MATVLFYEKPVLLHRDTHRRTRIAPLGPQGMAFAAKAHSLPITGVEFAEACKEYPVVFARDAAGKVQPVLMLGLREGENLFVDSTGKWDAQYLPAFVRRYPFVLVQLEGGNMGVCVDQAYAGLNETQGEALFDADGKNTQFLQNALDFVTRYQTEYARTEKFCQHLTDLQLLREMNAKAEMNDGASFTMGGLLVVDERKLLELTDTQALEVFRSGELAWVYSHLVSLSNVKRLMDRMAARRPAV